MVERKMLPSLLAGSIPAVIAGSALAHRLSGRWVHTALAIMLTAAGIKTVC